MRKQTRTSMATENRIPKLGDGRGVVLLFAITVTYHSLTCSQPRSDPWAPGLGTRFVTSPQKKPQDTPTLFLLVLTISYVSLSVPCHAKSTFVVTFSGNGTDSNPVH